MTTRQQLIDKINNLPENKLKELADFVKFIEGKNIKKEQIKLAESDMEDYQRQLLKYEDLLASGKIRWK